MDIFTLNSNFPFSDYLKKTIIIPFVKKLNNFD
jgi:hypothetical protein